MKVFIAVCASAALSSPLTWAASNYESSYLCLKTMNGLVPTPPAVFSRDGSGLFSATVSGRGGFMIVTPKAAFFFPLDEMTKSGDDGSNQMKVSVTMPENAVMKIFYNPQGQNPQDQISFGTANEFDRQIEPTALSESSVQTDFNTQIGRALYRLRILALTNKGPVATVLNACKGVTWDFPVSLGNGTDSKFQVEIQALREKLKPSVFSMEYWFPKKGATSAN